MRDETFYQWRYGADGSPVGRQITNPGRGNPLSTPDGPAAPPCHGTGIRAPRGILYAVEVCWLSDGAVTCRTYRVRATNECRAARIGRSRARRMLRRQRVSRIEAVDVEPILQGDGHE